MKWVAFASIVGLSELTRTAKDWGSFKQGLCRRDNVGLEQERVNGQQIVLNSSYLTITAQSARKVSWRAHVYQFASYFVELLEKRSRRKNKGRQNCIECVKTQPSFRRINKELTKLLCLSLTIDLPSFSRKNFAKLFRLIAYNPR